MIGWLGYPAARPGVGSALTVQHIVYETLCRAVHIVSATYKLPMVTPISFFAVVLMEEKLLLVMDLQDLEWFVETPSTLFLTPTDLLGFERSILKGIMEGQ